MPEPPRMMASCLPCLLEAFSGSPFLIPALSLSLSWGACLLGTEFYKAERKGPPKIPGMSCFKAGQLQGIQYGSPEPILSLIPNSAALVSRPSSEAGRRAES